MSLWRNNIVPLFNIQLCDYYYFILCNYVELCEGEMISWPRQDALNNSIHAEHVLDKASDLIAHAASMTTISQFAPIIR